ncbi:hypothetical protein ACXR2T_12330 [Leucobacter sp. HY1910]
MVDLHQVEPGLPDGHPWKTSSRWHMAWRTFGGVSLVGMAGTLFFSLITAGNGSLNIIETLFPYVFAAVVPLICAMLVVVLGPWLKRYYPFSQSLLMGGFAVLAVFVASAIASVWESINQGPCPADTMCASPLDGMFWVGILYGLPVFLSACVGFGISIWSLTRRGRKVFLPLWGALLAALATVLVVMAMK